MNIYPEQTFTCNNNVHFRYAVGPSKFDGREIHPYHEILYYIDGGATFLSETYEEQLSENTILIIPKNHYHQLSITNQNKYTRLAINFSQVKETQDLADKTMNSIKIIKNPDDDIKHLFDRMRQILTEKNSFEITNTFMIGSLIMLFAEINLDKTSISTPTPRENNIVSLCLEYIEKNLTHDITIKKIANELYISESTLSHTFKDALGISIHKYIIEKRLIYAHKLISNSVPATHVYLECGYTDYSSFYKAYTKMFGQAPSIKSKTDIPKI